MINWKQYLPFNYPCYEGDEDGDGGDSNDGGNKVTFTEEQQAKVDEIVATERRKYKKQMESQVEELETLKQKQGTSKAEQERLQKRIDNLKATYQTEADRKKEQHQEQITGLQNQLDNSNKSSDFWKNSYSKTVADTQIMAAAINHKAFKPQLVVDILGPKAELVEKLDEDGNGTNNWEVKIPMTKIDADKNVKEVKVSPAEAVELMTKQADTYGPLFETTSKGGAGANNEGGGAGEGGRADQDPDQVKSDPAAWRERYKKDFGVGVKP